MSDLWIAFERLQLSTRRRGSAGTLPSVLLCWKALLCLNPTPTPLPNYCHSSSNPGSTKHLLFLALRIQVCCVSFDLKKKIPFSCRSGVFKQIAGDGVCKGEYSEYLCVCGVLFSHLCWSVSHPEMLLAGKTQLLKANKNSPQMMGRVCQLFVGDKIQSSEHLPPLFCSWQSISNPFSYKNVYK